MENDNNTSNNTSKNTSKEYERMFFSDLHQYLAGLGRVDKHFPDAPDVEACWAKIGESYMPDGIREFNEYPTVSIGWIMYVGMAVAKYWDTDWELYSKVPDLYKYLRNRIDFDHIDDYVCEKILFLTEEQTTQLRHIIAECASRTYNTLMHLGITPGTPDAFYAYIAAIHVMYQMGAAMQLKAMGYHMAKLG